MRETAMLPLSAQHQDDGLKRLPLTRELGLLGEQPEWKALRERLRGEILRRGIDPAARLPSAGLRAAVRGSEYRRLMP
jgi:hypothetical protein